MGIIQMFGKSSGVRLCLFLITVVRIGSWRPQRFRNKFLQNQRPYNLFVNKSNPILIATHSYTQTKKSKKIGAKEGIVLEKSKDAVGGKFIQNKTNDKVDVQNKFIQTKLKDKRDAVQGKFMETKIVDKVDNVRGKVIENKTNDNAVQDKILVGVVHDKILVGVDEGKFMEKQTSDKPDTIQGKFIETKSKDKLDTVKSKFVETKNKINAVLGKFIKSKANDKVTSVQGQSVETKVHTVESKSMKTRTKNKISAVLGKFIKSKTKGNNIAAVQSIFIKSKTNKLIKDKLVQSKTRGKLDAIAVDHKLKHRHKFKEKILQLSMMTPRSLLNFLFHNLVSVTAIFLVLIKCLQYTKQMDKIEEGDMEKDDIDYGKDEFTNL